MTRSTFLALPVLALLLVPSTVHAQQVSGQFVTCPAGDPIVGASIHLFVDGVSAGSYTTDANGFYSVFINGNGQNTITATLGDLHAEYHHSYCPSGRSGVSCCIQVVGVLGTSNLQMPNLQLRCGSPGDPPCPSQ